MPEKNKVVVRIMGHEYTLVSEDTREYMQRVANVVDDKMKEIAAANKKLSTSMMAVLTALNVTDEYLKIAAHNEELEKRIQDPTINQQEVQDKIEVLQRNYELKSLEYERLATDFDKLVQSAKEHDKTIVALKLKIEEQSRTISERDSRVIVLESEKAELLEQLSLKERELVDFLDSFQEG
ncbi:cell division protein ZapA [Acidaminobacter hydrogenoformans]|uniref:Cell division protein ZapA n=1 Tax=Acidaminobacter hydrogenoformans DSM 2784 TaxID=1120920 RepID=A0A1G5RTW9_9FIRM|nr:cell division protein ZapA [Acidaminobacter hydrogenoformans]SCZ77565.1 cell division protein ZapA [Acidaminobacter hydrogenoformans DSM 2784]